MNKTTNIIYWAATGILGVGMCFSGIASLLGVEEVVGAIIGLGYPEFFPPFLGVLKILGGLTILLVKIPQIKTGAYAGIFFWLIGAIYSHLAFGDPITSVVPLVGLFVLAGTSFYLWNKHTLSPKLAA
ncbi:MAG: DoxX family protein [Bacteroidota bacterium]